MRTGMSRERQAVTTFWRSTPGAEGMAMTTSLGWVSSSTRGRSSVEPSTSKPAMRIPFLRGSSSMKPIGAVDSAGLRRSSVATCWPPLPAPTISTSRSADCTSGPRGRSTSGADQEAGADAEGEREQEVERHDPARRAGVARREEEQGGDQDEAGDHDRLDQRLEVLLVDEPPELGVEPEQREDRELHHHHEDEGVGEQLLVAVGHARVEAQDVGQVVGQPDQAGVDSHLPQAACLHGRDQ